MNRQITDASAVPAWPALCMLPCTQQNFLQLILRDAGCQSTYLLACNYNAASVRRLVSKLPPTPAISAAGAAQTQATAKNQSDNLGGQALSVSKAAPKQTHAELMVQMRQADEPLNVGGELHTQTNVQYSASCTYCKERLAIFYLLCVPERGH